MKLHPKKESFDNDCAYARLNFCGRLMVASKGVFWRGTSTRREALSRTVHGSNCAWGSPPATSVFDWTVFDPMLLAYSVGTAAFSPKNEEQVGVRVSVSDLVHEVVRQTLSGFPLFLRSPHHHGGGSRKCSWTGPIWLQSGDDANNVSYAMVHACWGDTEGRPAT